MATGSSLERERRKRRLHKYRLAGNRAWLIDKQMETCHAYLPTRLHHACRYTLLKILKGTMMVFRRCVHWINLNFLQIFWSSCVRAFYPVIFNPKCQQIQLNLPSFVWNWPFVGRIHRPPECFPHKGFVFFLVWNCWINIELPHVASLMWSRWIFNKPGLLD